MLHLLKSAGNEKPFAGLLSMLFLLIDSSIHRLMVQVIAWSQSCQCW